MKNLLIAVCGLLFAILIVPFSPLLAILLGVGWVLLCSVAEAYESRERARYERDLAEYERRRREP